MSDSKEIVSKNSAFGGVGSKESQASDEKGKTATVDDTNDIHNIVKPLGGLTLGIVDTFQKCSPDFVPATKKEHRVLTSPSVPAGNDGLDNEEANLICRVYDKLISHHGVVYTIIEGLGNGTFGQVFRCQREGTRDIVAVKVIKNKPAYHKQGLLEVKIVHALNTKHDPHDTKSIVRVDESFEYKGHICIVFELLNMSLLDILSQNQFRGLPLTVVQRFTRQLLTALATLESANIIHCDIKPENILLSTVKAVDDIVETFGEGTGASAIGSLSPLGASTLAGNQTHLPPSSPSSTAPSSSSSSSSSSQSSQLGNVKLIDFGSACYEGQTSFSYIQSRFYRSPEVLLGSPYNGAIDMWSLACVCTEMYVLFYILPFFPYCVLSLSYPSIAACLHSLTPRDV
jgi:serine/threonine protein kinase